MTLNHYRNQLKVSKVNYCLATALKHNPQMRGRVVRVVIRTPKKPNSALRKTGKIFLRTRKIVYAKIAGSGYLPTKFSVILIRGSGFKDTPAINYTIIRGA
jgi:small subunit ribosomal protein S12